VHTPVCQYGHDPSRAAIEVLSADEAGKPDEIYFSGITGD